MIRNIVEALLSDDWHNVSETVDIAKGKYKGAETFTEVKNQIKRKWQRQEKR